MISGFHFILKTRNITLYGSLIIFNITILFNNFNQNIIANEKNDSESGIKTFFGKYKLFEYRINL